VNVKCGDGVRSEHDALLAEAASLDSGLVLELLEHVGRRQLPAAVRAQQRAGVDPGGSAERFASVFFHGLPTPTYLHVGVAHSMLGVLSLS
jgi:hypothetical protein